MSASLSAPAAVVPRRGILKCVVVGDSPRALPPLDDLVQQRRVAVRHTTDWNESLRNGSTAVADAVIVIPPASMGSAELEIRLNQLSITLAACRIGALVVHRQPMDARAAAGDLLIHVPWQMEASELWGRLATIAHYRIVLAQLERQIESMQRLGKRLNRQFVEVDQEMQLATRLQRDFLPRELPRLGTARFASLFRPASWVSGDIYDVYRVDENHVAFYVADAVGHGVAAGLLTMLIKQAVRSKLTSHDTYRMLTPSETMARLNEALIEQNLQNSQFVTACYCLLNTETMEMSYSRGGHPYPLHIASDGTIRELKVDGGLLGLFEEEPFPNATVRLQPGEKVVLFSDGIEAALMHRRERTDGRPVFTRSLIEAAHGSAEDFIRAIAQVLDSQEGSLNPEDDATLVVLETIVRG